MAWAIWVLTTLLLRVSLVASKGFSLDVDLLGFPQFEIAFSDAYILETDATRLAALPRRSDLDSEDRSPAIPVPRSEESYQRMVLDTTPYLCAIPQPSSTVTEAAPTVDPKTQESELAKATERGWRLLQPLEDQCLYYTSGWWSYSFCYKDRVRQFHARPAGQGGAPLYPPMEDYEVPAFMLGSYHATSSASSRKGAQLDAGSSEASSDLQGLPAQTKGDTRYLVQRLTGGTECDITSRPRTIEIQFHCHPDSNDRIGWIRETSTCAYLMMIYTPRLCKDVAFMTPKATEASKIDCKEIVSAEQLGAWKARRAAEAQRKLIGSEEGEIPSSRPMVGDIEVGGMNQVGRDGRFVEPPSKYDPIEDDADTVASFHPDHYDGKVHKLTRTELNRMDLDLRDMEEMIDELNTLAEGKPWRLVVVEFPTGARELRGIIEQEYEQEYEQDSEVEQKRKQLQEQEPPDPHEEL